MRYAACAALCLSATVVLAQPDLLERTITVEEARERVKDTQGGISLNVTSLSPEVAAALTPYPEDLDLYRIKAVPDETAKLLAQHKGKLFMRNLVELTNTALAAKLIASVDEAGSLPCLQSLRVISDDVERLFARQNGRLVMPALTALSTAELAARLSEGAEGLQLRELRSVSPAAAEALAQTAGLLSLPMLEVLESRALAAKLNFHINGNAGRVALISPEVADLCVEAANATQGGFLSLPLTTMSPEVAAILARSNGELILDDLENLTVPVARALATHAGELSLGVTDLSPEAALELRPHTHSLCLPRLRELPKPLWDKLVGHAGDLVIHGVTELPNDVAAALSKRSGSLSLGLREVTPELARELIRVKGPLGLRGVASLNDAVQDILAQHTDRLYLGELTSLTSGKLARKLGAPSIDPNDLPLDLPYVTEITPEVAEGLALNTEGLSLDGLTTLPKDVAAALSACRGYLRLPAVATLDDEAAEALSRHKGEDLSLGVKELSDAAVASLARHPGDGLYLGVTAVSDHAARSLAAFGGQSLGLGVTELSDEAALALAGFKGKSLGLRNLQNVSAQGQDSLATFKGSLDLDRLHTLFSKALAEKMVAEWEERTQTNYFLDELTRVSPEVAEVLSRFKRPLFLKQLTELSSQPLARKLVDGLAGMPWLSSDAFRHLETLSPEAARELASMNASRLDLESMATLEPEVAAELVTFKGRLSFGSIATVSDETAKALSEHQGGLELPKLTALTSGKLAEVIEKPFLLGFPEVRELSPEAAKVLARRGLMDGGFSSPETFPKLATLSDDTAQAIGDSEAKPSLKTFSALRELTNAALAEKLFANYATWAWDGPRSVRTDLITTISPEVALVIGRSKSLYENSSTLHLNGLQHLDVETARGLAAFEGPLSLNGLTTISPGVAAELAKHRGKSSKGSGFVPEPIICLDGVCQLSKDTAEALATYEGRVSLDGLHWNELTDDVKAVVAKNDKVLIVKKPK